MPTQTSVPPLSFNLNQPIPESIPETFSTQTTTKLIPQVIPQQPESQPFDDPFIKPEDTEFPFSAPVIPPVGPTHDEAGPSNTADQPGPSSSKSRRLTELEQRERTLYLRRPFLEDDERRLFVHRIRTLNPYAVLGITDQTADYKFEYMYFLRDKCQKKRDVRNKKLIVTIKEVTARLYYKLWYPEFVVQRQDCRDYRFTEADFCHLTMEDFEFMYHHFRDLQIRRENVTLALNAIKRFLRRHILFTQCHDLQMAVESNQPRVNLLRPNQELAGLIRMPLYAVIGEPEFGVVFRNGVNKIFIRLNELEKYSDGTLKVVRLQLVEKLKRHDAERKINWMSSRPRRVLSRAIEEIDERLNFRMAMRRIETYLGFRRRRRPFLP